jgi:hypothetical protein
VDLVARNLPLACVASALAFAGGCKKHPAPAAPPSASAASSVTPPPAPVARCSAVGSRGGYAIGETGAAAPDPDDDAGDDVAMPFAVEIGSAVGYAGGFAVAFLRPQGGGTGAAVALVDADGGNGRIVDLGRRYGDVDPPELASYGSELVAGMPSGDVSGTALRLVAIRGAPDHPSVVWGPRVSQGNHESQVFGIELGPERGLLAWDDLDKLSQHGVIRASSFARDDVAHAGPARVISPKDEDVEAPHLARRPGGFWVAWIRHEKPKKKGKSAPPSAAASAAGPQPLVELGYRALEVMPLDEQAVPAGDPKPITPPRSHVLVFDLAPAPGGGAFLAWRDDEAAPGEESRIVHLALVGADGSVHAHVIDDERVGAGVPTLLVDPAPAKTDRQAAWLALAGVRDKTRLVALDAGGDLLDDLGTEPLIERTDPLALDAGHLLLATPRRLAMDLSVVSCRPGPPPSADAGAPSP